MVCSLCFLTGCVHTLLNVVSDDYLSAVCDRVSQISQMCVCVCVFSYTDMHRHTQALQRQERPQKSTGSLQYLDEVCIDVVGVLIGCF